MSQKHTKVKAFIGPDGDNVINQAKDFIFGHAIRPISLGVEYLEKTSQVVLTLGYANLDGTVKKPDATGFHQVALGKLSLEPEIIERAMSEAIHKVGEDVICHEFYVNESGEFFAVFMTAVFTG